MTAVVPLRRSATVLWSPTNEEVVPVHSPSELAAHVSAWRAYGEAVRVFTQSGDGREAAVTALGEDGWLVKVRHTKMVKGSWPYSRIVTRVPMDGTPPTRSQWYMPNESTDLAGTVLFTELIQFAPADAAQAAWAWLNVAPMPDGFAAGASAYDHSASNSVDEALQWIADSDEAPWPLEAGQAAIELAENLGVDRVIVTSPGQITARVLGTGRRVRFQRRGQGTDEHIRVVGMVDELGREYTVRLPEQTIIRISRGRPHR